MSICICNFDRYCQISLHRGCTILHIHPECMKTSVSVSLLPNYLIFASPFISHSMNSFDLLFVVKQLVLHWLGSDKSCLEEIIIVTRKGIVWPCQNETNKTLKTVPTLLKFFYLWKKSISDANTKLSPQMKILTNKTVKPLECSFYRVQSWDFVFPA